ncbi:hypothetical protein P691DRAFT_246308 [Macrolepiota fuliginosa MF-IS2]|uniref:F-box domain-containing protein n=1 Tax=Macrolepiota fuliginosa MF-IS2 TaxID=1400762 RepID=A0A9P5XJX0_9AGAR|nr:hypothetical protein P691DRAFT_246308 [Macrolepiota fuliginosa MF-IS2]
MSTTSTAQDGALAKLPDNVLHNVFDRLKPWELLCLARISERIQRVSLAIYYDRRGVDVSPTGIIDITREGDYDLFAILRITTFFTRTGHISVVFVFPKWNFMENIRNLTLILKRLVSVDMITLTFRFDPETRVNEENRPALLTAEARSSKYKGLSKELQSLFSAAFRVAGVVRILESEQLLKMVGGDLHDNFLILSCFGVNGPPVISRYKVAAKVRMNKIIKLASRKPQEKVAIPPPKSSVVFLDIRSLVPLVPPFLSWTVICLNFQQRLRHLSFTTNSDERVYWDPLLSNLHIPSLVQLTMNSNSCTLSDLAKFVKRHFQLSILDIHDFAPMPIELPKVANLAFKHISSLTAPCEVLSAFFSYPVDLLPNLKEVHVALSVTERRPLDLPQVWATMAPVAERLRNIESVGLVVAYEAGESPFGKSLEGEGKPTLISLVKTLTLRLKVDLESDIIGHLAGWIMAFTNIHELRVESAYPYRYPIQTFFAKRAIAAEEEKKKIREDLSQELREKLVVMGKLESCEIFGQRYPLAADASQTIRGECERCKNELDGDE